MSQNYQKIIDNPGEWIITRYGDFIRIKDSEKLVDKNLGLIRKKLKLSGRFKEKTPEQIQKEKWRIKHFGGEKSLINGALPNKNPQSKN